MTPACPLATVLYRFNDAARFPVFESHTIARGPIAIQADRDEVGGFLRINYQRQEADLDEITIALALPLVGVNGRLRKLLLDVFGDSSGCHLYLEGMDANGNLVTLSFGLVDFDGWRTLRADASKLVPPVQFHRLRLTIAPSSHAVHLGIRMLSLTGEVRVSAAGIT